MSTVATLLTILVLLTGLGGGVAAAADASSPDQALYPVDQVLEQAQVRWGDPRYVQLRLAAERADEMIAQAERGLPVDEALLIRLQEHLNLAIHAAADQDDAAMLRTMDQLRDMTQDRIHQLDQLGLEDAARLMTRAQDQAQDCIDDPDRFRDRIRDGWDIGENETDEDESTDPAEEIPALQESVPGPQVEQNGPQAGESAPQAEQNGPHGQPQSPQATPQAQQNGPQPTPQGAQQGPADDAPGDPAGNGGDAGGNGGSSGNGTRP